MITMIKEDSNVYDSYMGTMVPYDIQCVTV